MGLFDIFKTKKVELTNEQQKWNKMWDLWVEGEAISPYAELMTYQSEINNGGHDQYFTNVENTGDLQKEMSALENILSQKLICNLQKAYEAYLVLEEKEDDEQAEEILEQCDDVFYENEEEINHLLKEYAEKMEL
jgi:tetratricopeptide (TPR) repeat protein